MVKQYQQSLNYTPNAIGAFNLAVASVPDVISCSWGSKGERRPLDASEKLFSAAIAVAVRRGIIVVFSAGNGHFAFPGEHPDVICVGGVFMSNEGSLKASNYASSFRSDVFPNRNCPDVCGLVGLLPRAAYIMLPLPPRCEIDIDLSIPPDMPQCEGQTTHPCVDETLEYDGWAAISGTSAAAPQVAGVCALMKQANPNITPSQAKELLKNSAIDVLEGQSGAGDEKHTAGPGPDLATGNGLVNAFQAVSLALQNRVNG